MKFRCTACTARLHVPRRWAGVTIECPKCMTRVVVPAEAAGSQPVRFEDRSIEKRIEAFEASLAAVNAAASGGPQSAGDSPPTAVPAAGRERLSRAMIAVPSEWIPSLAAAVVVAIAAAAAAGFWLGWLASQASAKEVILHRSKPARFEASTVHSQDGSGRR